MINIILFSIISSLVITIITYIESNMNEENEKHINSFFKTFIISFVINLISIYVFKNIGEKDIYSIPIEVGLPD